MKKLLLLITWLFFSLNLSAQITTTNIAEKKNEIDNAPYDSTKNFLGANVHQYVGQVLYLKEKNEKLREYGYEGFVENYKRNTRSRRNIYKCCQSYNSKYSELAGLYFDVLGVYKHPDVSENESLYGSTYFLELREQKSGDKVYYKHDTEFKHSFPFVVVGYFEKVRVENLDRKLVVRGPNWYNSDSTMPDVHTGEPVSLKPGSIWKVVDLTIENRFYTMVFLIENENGETVQISPQSAEENKFVFEYSEALKHEKKFGAETWNKILIGKVGVGFTEEMAKLSWGEPEQINRSSHGGDQWVYDGQFLYFEDGKLVAWN